MKNIGHIISKFANPLFYLPLSLFVIIRVLYFAYDFSKKSEGFVPNDYFFLSGAVVLSAFLGYLALRKYRKNNKLGWLIVGITLSFVLPGIFFYIFLRLEQLDLSLLKSSDELEVGDVMCYFYTYSIFHRVESPKLDNLKKAKLAEYFSILPNDIYQKLKI